MIFANSYLLGENERRLEQMIMAVRYDQYPMGFVPKIFPLAIQLEGETNGDQIDNMRESMAITLLDLIENRIIECEGRKKQEARGNFSATKLTNAGTLEHKMVLGLHTPLPSPSTVH